MLYKSITHITCSSSNSQLNYSKSTSIYCFYLENVSEIPTMKEAALLLAICFLSRFQYGLSSVEPMIGLKEVEETQAAKGQEVKSVLDGIVDYDKTIRTRNINGIFVIFHEMI